MSSNYYTRLLNIYIDQLKGNLTESAESLIRYKPDLEKDTFYNIATWVWVLQKQVYLQPENQDITRIDYDPYIHYLQNEWSNAHSRIWDDEKEDVYLSNIAMAYAALSETKNNRKQFYIQKTMTEIRDYVFDNLLFKGTVLNGVKERRIAVDEILSVMPYGLFSPEDLIIVEAVQKITTELDNGDGLLLPYVGAQKGSTAATAMVALYYLEKSDKEKALYYANATRLNSDYKSDELGKTILSIYDFFVSEDQDETNQVIHDPLGNDNVYISQLTERSPHFPTLSDNMTLTCQVISEDTIDSVFLQIDNESETWNHKEEMSPTEKNNTLLYESNIGPLPYHEKYYYFFTATTSSGSKISSEKFEVTTLQSNYSKSFNLVDQTKDSLLLTFGKDDYKYGLSLSFKDNGLDMTLHQGLSDLGKEISKSSTTLQYEEYDLEVSLDNASIELYKGNKKVLATHPLYAPIEWKIDPNGQVSEFKINWYSPAHEKFYGFGERYNAMEQRGRVIDCFVYNQYRDQGTITYMPIPFYMTNKGYGCFVDVNTYTKFDVASELKDKLTVTIEQVPEVQESNVHIYFGDYKEQVKSYINDTGQPTMLPAWALGPWMSSNNWDRQSIVEKEVKTTNKYNIPATVLVIEQWTDETTYYMFNDAEYDLKDPGEIHSYEDMTFPEWGRWPDPKGMVNYLHENNLKLMLWQIPIQKYLNKQRHPLKDQDEKYMIDKGYVVKNEDGTPYRIPENWFTNSLLMDFSNEEGRKWWFEKRQYLIDIGVDGFKTDGGEFVFGKNLQFSNGQSGSEMRNKYPNDYVSAYYDFAQQNDGITFSRAGYTGAQNFPAHWAGDERSTFGAFKRSLIAGLNAGLAGIVFWGWDLSGFNGDIPTAELFMRSSAMAAFCPIMQYHAESKAEFSQDRTPWNIAERTKQPEVIDVYRFYANLRMNFMPYIYQEAKKASETGIPLMRALMIDYPTDERVQGLYDQYLFGDSLLVAPVIEEGAVSRKVYLPDGEWFNIWSNEKISGPSVTNVDADVDEIPVFVKANDAILLNVDESKQFGSSVGNDTDVYRKPLCKIYYDDAFEKVLFDHLGNKVFFSISDNSDELLIKVDSDIKNIEFQVIGSQKPLRVVQERLQN